MYLQSITQRQSDNKLFTLLISPKKRKRNEFSDSMTYTTQTWPHVKRATHEPNSELIRTQSKRSKHKLVR